MTEQRTREVFDHTARSYDGGRARLIPCYDEFYGTAVGLIPAGADPILDLGAGTGLLSAMIHERFPDARLHLLDNSEAMLAQALARFTGDPKIQCQLGDYTSASWGGSYAAVVSALSIHHLTDEAKRKLFVRIHEALTQGGVFINAEQILASTAQLEEQARIDWLAEVRALGATDEQVAASLLRQTEDRCATIADQLDWIREAGFSQARCAFQQGRFAVFRAIR